MFQKKKMFSKHPTIFQALYVCFIHRTRSVQFSKGLKLQIVSAFFLEHPCINWNSATLPVLKNSNTASLCLSPTISFEISSSESASLKKQRSTLYIFKITFSYDPPFVGRSDGINATAGSLCGFTCHTLYAFYSLSRYRLRSHLPSRHRHPNHPLAAFSLRTRKVSRKHDEKCHQVIVKLKQTYLCFSSQTAKQCISCSLPWHSQRLPRHSNDS